MRKNKLYLILALIISVILFTTGALCNQCTAAGTEETAATAEQEPIQEEETAEEAVEEEPTQEEETAEEEPSEEEPAEEESEEESTEEEEEETQTAYEEPTISLEVYEGPLYSSADDVCYWRVKAIVTGVPIPTVEFNRDDSNGAWGSRKVQVNLANPADSYSLQATATNSEGAATDSIMLVWECNRSPEIADIVMMGDHYAGVEYEVSASASDPDGDTLTYAWSVNGGTLDSTTGSAINWTMPATAGNYQITVEADDGNGGTDQRTETVAVTDIPIYTIELSIVSSEGGYIKSNGTVYSGDYHMVGDNMSNQILKTYYSFDIGLFSGVQILSAKLTCASDGQVGNLTVFKPLMVSSVYWGAEELIDTDFNLSGDIIDTFSAASFMSSSQKLKLYLKNALNDGKDRFQLMMFFTGTGTDNDSLFDYWSYHESGVSLEMTYQPIP